MLNLLSREIIVILIQGSFDDPDVMSQGYQALVRKI